jgi:hypothetical protein
MLEAHSQLLMRKESPRALADAARALDQLRPSPACTHASRDFLQRGVRPEHLRRKADSSVRAVHTIKRSFSHRDLRIRALINILSGRHRESKGSAFERPCQMARRGAKEHGLES